MKIFWNNVAAIFADGISLGQIAQTEVCGYLVGSAMTQRIEKFCGKRKGCFVY